MLSHVPASGSEVHEATGTTRASTVCASGDRASTASASGDRASGTTAPSVIELGSPDPQPIAERTRRTAYVDGLPMAVDVRTSHPFFAPRAYASLIRARAQ